MWGVGDQLEKTDNTKARGGLYGMAGVEEDAPPTHPQVFQWCGGPHKDNQQHVRQYRILDLNPSDGSAATRCLWFIAPTVAHFLPCFVCFYTFYTRWAPQPCFCMLFIMSCWCPIWLFMSIKVTFYVYQCRSKDLWVCKCFKQAPIRQYLV